MPGRKTTRRKSPKRTKRTKRKKRKTPKRKSPKRKSPKRKSPKRKSPKRTKRKKRKTTSGKKPKPTNMKLYNRVKAEAKRKFKVWPSAYASGWLVREYKKRGGKYSGKKPGKSTGLGRWFEEKWINVCKLPKKVACGRPKTSLSNWKKKYPYCRPSKKVTSATPKLASQLSKAQIKKRCSRKRANPRKKVMPSKRKKRRKSPTKRKRKKSPKKRKKRRKSPTKRKRKK